MDALSYVDILLSIIDALVCAGIVLVTVPRIRSGKTDSVPLAFFVFALISVALSDVYWVVYPIMRPDTRMPIAANEMGEIACFLLLSSAIRLAYRNVHVPAKTEVIGAALFALAQIIFWIIWTGEWMQDILGGAAFGYTLCVCAWALKQEDCLSSGEWRLLGLSCLVIIVCNIIWFYLPESFKTADIALANLTSIAWIIVLLAKTTKAMKEGASAAKQIALSFALFAWSISTMFMADGYYYYVGLVFSIIAKLYMDMAVKKEVTGE
jgi:hypothetical protein